jgi:uncharacterized membrane protein
MDIILLRLVHIASGAFWFGSAFVIFLFLQPTAMATAPESNRFMLHLLGRRRLTEATLTAAALTVAAGSILLWRDSNGLDATWISNPPGLGFTIGAAAAWLAFLGFLFIGYPAGRRITDIGGRLADERRPPTPGEQQQLAASQQRLRRLGMAVLALLTVAIICMATARYWSLVI